MKEILEKRFKIEKDIADEVEEIGEILRSSESENIKLESIRAILLRLAEEITDAKGEKFYEDRTGLLASKYGEDFVTQEIENCKRNDRTFTIALLDVDCLKNINDKFGHVAGTKVIIDLAESIKKVLRKSDVASRYGGDEFLVILPETNIVMAQRAVERIRKGINGINHGSKVKVSFSVGLAEFDGEKSETALKMIERADKEMYSNKKNHDAVNCD